jgi:hypothetical protein
MSCREGVFSETRIRSDELLFNDRAIQRDERCSRER